MKTLKSEIVDNIIDVLEFRMKNENKNLIKTETIFDMCSNRIDLTDDSDTRTELLEIGIRQVIQSRLYARNYFSVSRGYFVNIDRCENLYYLQMIVDNKDDVIVDKTAVRNKIKELTGLNGQLTLIPDKNGMFSIKESKTLEEIMSDIEADAV